MQNVFLVVLGAVLIIKKSKKKIFFKTKNFQLFNFEKKNFFWGKKLTYQKKLLTEFRGLRYQPECGIGPIKHSRKNLVPEPHFARTRFYQFHFCAYLHFWLAAI
jgi:hypothetical protein